MTYRVEEYIRGMAYAFWHKVCECESLEQARQIAHALDAQGKRTHITDGNGFTIYSKEG